MLSLNVVQTASALSGLTSAWAKLRQQTNEDAPASEPHWLHAACERAAAAGHLRVVSFRHEGRLVGVAPFQLKEQGRGPLRRNVLSLLAAAPLDVGARGSLLVASGFEQAVVEALVAALDAELRDWERVEVAGLATDGALPSLLFANAAGLGVPELTMFGFERRRKLNNTPPERPHSWVEVNREAALKPATDDALIRRYIGLLERSGQADVARLGHAAKAAREHGATVWGLHHHEELVAVAITLRGGGGDRFVVATGAAASAPSGSERALHVMLIEDAAAGGAEQYVAWCDAPAELFDDNCPIRSLTIERYSSTNTRNRLWNRLASWRR